MMEPVHDDVFVRQERLETRYVVQLSEENIAKVASLLRWSVDYSGEDPVLVKPNNEHGYGGRTFDIGTVLDNKGERADSLGWYPSGTWVEKEDL